MKITALARQKRSKDQVNVDVDGEFRLSIATEVALRANLRVGREIDETTLETLEKENTGWHAKAAALRLLAHRPRTENEVRQDLMRKGFSRAIADDCVGQFQVTGLLDDLAFAREFVSQRLRTRPSGSTRLVAELRAKGIAPDVAETAVRDLLQEGSESELDVARRALRKFPSRRDEEPNRARHRLYSYLARRGFSGETIAQIADEVYSE